MSDTGLVHVGKKSLFGTVRTLCGLKVPASQAPMVIFAGPKCPACQKLKKAGVRL